MTDLGKWMAQQRAQTQQRMTINPTTERFFSEIQGLKQELNRPATQPTNNKSSDFLQKLSNPQGSNLSERPNDENPALNEPKQPTQNHIPEMKIQIVDQDDWSKL